MYVNSISSVGFGNTQAAPVSLDRKGAYTKPDVNAEPAAAPKKKSHVVRNTVLGLAATAVALVAAKHFNLIKVLESVEGASMMQKAGHYLAKGADAIANYTYRPIMKLFNK